jgi:hypothetical protein
MKLYKTIAIAAATALAMTACSGPSEPVQTVDWYKTHAPERTAMYQRCHDNPGELRGTPNCVNAAAAVSTLAFSGMGYGTSAAVPPKFSAKH